MGQPPLRQAQGSRLSTSDRAGTGTPARPCRAKLDWLSSLLLRHPTHQVYRRPSLHRNRAILATCNLRPCAPENVKIRVISPPMSRIARNRHSLHQLIVAVGIFPCLRDKSPIFFQRGSGSPRTRNVRVDQEFRLCPSQFLHHVILHLPGKFLPLQQRIGIQITAGAVPAGIETNLRFRSDDCNRILLRRVRFDLAADRNRLHKWICVEYLSA